MKHLSKEETEQLIELLDRLLHDERLSLDIKAKIVNVITALIKVK